MKRIGLGPCVAALAAAVWCASYTRPLLDPFTLEVVLRDDWAQHTLGWLFFRHAPWRWPLGALPAFFYPLGTTLGYMDSIPWLALCLRPFSALLPADFQYLGLWLLSCSAALGFAGARIASRLTPHWEQQAFAGALVAFSPTLMLRIVHPALCAHWMIVSTLGLALAPPNAPGLRRRLCSCFVLLLLSAATHPYIAIMVLAIAVGVPGNARAALGKRVMAAVIAGMFATTAGALALFGYLGGGMDDVSAGFGAYSANLNALINSMGHSRLLGSLPAPQTQREGYGYLGAGVLSLVLLALIALAAPSTRHRLLAFRWRLARWPLLAATACAIFALASPVRWGEHELFRIAPYAHVQSFVQTFRSSGRFIWPLMYTVVALAIIATLLVWRERRVRLSALLAAAALIQLYDVDTSDARNRFEGRWEPSLGADAWELAGNAVDHLALYPPQIKDTCNFDKGYQAAFVTDLAYLAYRKGWTFNSGYGARTKLGTQAYCADFEQNVPAHELRADSLYVVPDAGDQRRFRSAGATCGVIDRVGVCVAGATSPLASYLAAHRKR